MANEINGTDLYVFSNGVVIAHATSHTLSVKMADRKTSNKDTGIWETSASSRLDATASCDGMMVYGDIDILRAAMTARTPLALDFGEQTGGALNTNKIYAMGNFLLVGLDESAPDAGTATYKASFTHSSGFQYVSSGALNVRIAHTDCGGIASMGAAFAIAAGGTPFGSGKLYTFAWTGGATTQYIVGKAAGTYTVTVTDNASPTPATATATVTILA